MHLDVQAMKGSGKGRRALDIEMIILKVINYEREAFKKQQVK
jgi:hypothetical protein